MPKISSSNFLILGESKGEVIFYQSEVSQLANNKLAFKCFDEEITAIALSDKADLFAVASKEGRTIKVYSTSDQELKYTFTRGKKPSKIDYLSFEVNSSKLVVSSDRKTTHVFTLVETDHIKNVKSRLEFFSKVFSYCDQTWSWV